MLTIQSKLVDIKTNKCIGVICINGSTSVALSLDKAKELGVDDIDIIEYLGGVVITDVVVNTRRPNYFASLDKSLGELEEYSDLSYDRIGNITNTFELKEVIWGHIFKYIDFIELDNDTAIRNALADAEGQE